MKLDNINKYPCLADSFAPFTKKQRLFGTVSFDTYRVTTICVFLRASLELLGSTNVRPDGTWEIEVRECPLEGILVIAKDETNTYNCDTFDRVSQVSDIIIHEQNPDILPKNYLYEDMQCMCSDYFYKFPAVFSHGTPYGIDKIRIQNGKDLTFYKADDSVIDTVPSINMKFNSLLIAGSKGSVEHLYTLNKGVTDILGDNSCKHLFEFHNDYISASGTSSGMNRYDDVISYSAYKGCPPEFNNLFGRVTGFLSQLNSYDNISFFETKLETPFSISFVFHPLNRGAATNRTVKIPFLQVKNIAGNTVWYSFKYGHNNNISATKFGCTVSGITEKELNYVVPLGAPVHVIFGVTSTTISLQINGVTVATAAYVKSPDFTQKDITKLIQIGIEGVPASYFFFQFFISKIRVFNKVLTDAEAAIVYNADFVNSLNTDFTKIGKVQNFSIDNAGLYPIKSIGKNALGTITFSKDDFYLDVLNSYSTFSLYNSILSDKGIKLNGAILHKVVPSTSLNTNASLPDHSNVSIIGKINTEGCTFTGTQCIYKSGDGSNGIGIYLVGATLKICGRVGGTYSELIIPTQLVVGEYIFVYDNTGFYLYNLEYTMLSSVAGQVVCGITSTDQESIGNSAGNSPYSALTNNPEYYRGIVREILIIAKGQVLFSSKLSNKVYVEDKHTGSVLNTYIENIDPINNKSSIVVQVPEISSARSINLRLFADSSLPDNPKTKVEDYIIPTGVSTEWDYLVGLNNIDSLCSYDVLQRKADVKSKQRGVGYTGFNFPMGMYTVSGPYHNIITRTSVTGSGAVRFIPRPALAIDSVCKRLYCEIVLNTDAQGVYFGALYDNSAIGADISYGLFTTPAAPTWTYRLGTANYIPSPLPLTAGTVFKIALDVESRLMYLGYNEFWASSGTFTTNFYTAGSSGYSHLLANIALALLGEGASATVRFLEKEFSYPMPAGYSDYSKGLRVPEFTANNASFLVIPEYNNADYTGTRVFYNHGPCGTSSATTSIRSKRIQNTRGDVFFVFNKYDNVFISFAASDIFNPSSHDYSLDFYFIRNSTPRLEYLMGVMDANSNGFYIGIEEGLMTVTFMDSLNAQASRYTVRGVRRLNDIEEHHFALSIDSGVIYLFVDGALDIIQPLSTDVCATLLQSQFVIGNAGSSSYGFDGYISYVCIFKGFSRWTSSFTPPLPSSFFKDKILAPTNINSSYSMKNIGTNFEIYRYFDISTNSRITVGNVSVGAGKFYMELLLPRTSALVGGICNARVIPGTALSSTDMIMAQLGSITIGGIVISAPATYFTGQFQCWGFAIDTIQKKIWVSLNGRWLNGLFPDSGTSLGTIPDSFFDTQLFPFVGYNSTATYEVAVLLTKYSEFMYPIPDGYTAWVQDSRLKYDYQPYLDYTTADFVYAKSTTYSGTDETHISNCFKKINKFNVFQYQAPRHWLSSSTSVTNQKLNFDVGRSVVINRIGIVNGHTINNSTYFIENTNTGIKDFSLYGTNSIDAFNNTVYSDTTDLTLLGSYSALAYNASVNMQEFKVANTASFRYYVLRVSNNHGSTANMRLNYIEFFKIDTPNASNKELIVRVNPISMDEDLYDFPVKIKLGNSSGITSLDTSSIFDIIGEDYSKLYITDELGVNLPIEVVKWDATLKEAILWTKFPKIKSSNVSNYNYLSVTCYPLDNGDVVLHGEYSDKILFTYFSGTTAIQNVSISPIKFNRYNGMEVTPTGPYYALKDMGTNLLNMSNKEWCAHSYILVSSFTVTSGDFAYLLHLSSTYGISVIAKKDTGEVGIVFSYNTVEYTYSGVNIPLGEIFHISLSRKGDFIQAHLNGSLILSYELSANFSFGDSYGFLYLGNRGATSYVFPSCTFFLPTFVRGTNLWDSSKFVPPIHPLDIQYSDSFLRVNFNTENSPNSNIGIIGSDAGKSVWSNGYRAVLHMNDISGNTIPNSVGTEVFTKFGSNVSKDRKNGFDGLQIGIDSYISTDYATAFRVYTEELFVIIDETSFYTPYAGNYTPILTHEGSGISYGPDVTFMAGNGYIGVYNPGAWSYFPVLGVEHTRNFILNHDGYQQELYEYVNGVKRTATIPGPIVKSRNDTGGFTSIGSLDTEYNSFVGFVYGYRLSTVKRSASWNNTSQLTLNDKLLVYDYSQYGKYIGEVSEEQSNASVADISINTNWMTETLTNFPVKLELDSLCGINGADFTGFFKTLAIDANVIGPFIREYTFYVSSNPFNNCIINNTPIGSSLSLGPTGFKFSNEKQATAGTAAVISNVPRMYGDFTVAFRVCMNPAESSNTAYYNFVAGKLNASSPTGEFGIYMNKVANSHYGIKVWHNKVGTGGENALILDPNAYPIVEGAWYNIVIVREISKKTNRTFTFKIYVNEVLAASASFPYCPPDGEEGTYSTAYKIMAGMDLIEIGNCSYSGFYGLNGTLDNFLLIPDYVFSEREVKEFSTFTKFGTDSMHGTVIVSQDYSIPVLKGRALTSLSIGEVSGTAYYYVTVSFNKDTYWVYKNDAWIVVASKEISVHGGSLGVWHYRDTTGAFIECPINEANEAITRSLEYTQYQAYTLELENWDFSLSSYNASTGICDIGITCHAPGLRRFAAAGYISSICFNNTFYKISDPIDLTEYDGIIKSSKLIVSYSHGTSIKDVTNKIKVYCKLSSDTDWTLCYFNQPIPVLTEGMNTAGKTLIYRVEFGMDTGIESNGINITTQIF